VTARPYALFIRGQSQTIFDLSDKIGFESQNLSPPSEPLAISVFEDGPDTMHIQALFETYDQAQACFSGLDIPKEMEGFITQLDDEDWVARSQSGLPPVIAGPFCLHGAHDKDNIPADSLYPIQIEAGMAFGTGHHGTTKGCLLALDDLLKAGLRPQSALDLGCGAGILAIAFIKASAGFFDGKVLATDIDPDAITITRENAAINGVSERIETVLSEGFQDSALAGRQFEFIFANILAEPLMAMAGDIYNALTPGGHVILSGILDEKSHKVAEHFKQTGLSIEMRPSIEGWTNLVGRK